MIALFTTKMLVGEPIPKFDELYEVETTPQQDANNNAYVKELFTDQQIYTSGVVYRYVNNIDPNKDLICDSAKYDGPLKIEMVPDYPK